MKVYLALVFGCIHICELLSGLPTDECSSNGAASDEQSALFEEIYNIYSENLKKTKENEEKNREKRSFGIDWPNLGFIKDGVVSSAQEVNDRYSASRVGGFMGGLWDGITGEKSFLWKRSADNRRTIRSTEETGEDEEENEETKDNSEEEEEEKNKLKNINDDNNNNLFEVNQSTTIEESSPMDNKEQNCTATSAPPFDTTANDVRDLAIEKEENLNEEEYYDDENSEEKGIKRRKREIRKLKRKREERERGRRRKREERIKDETTEIDENLSDEDSYYDDENNEEEEEEINRRKIEERIRDETTEIEENQSEEDYYDESSEEEEEEEEGINRRKREIRNLKKEERERGERIRRKRVIEPEDECPIDEVEAKEKAEEWDKYFKGLEE